MGDKGDHAKLLLYDVPKHSNRQKCHFCKPVSQIFKIADLQCDQQQQPLFCDESNKRQ